MILHLISKSPFTHHCLQLCLSSLGKNDGIVLLEDGVLLLSQPSAIPQLNPPQQLFALTQDLTARGLPVTGSQASSIRCIDFPELVELVAQYDKTLTW